MMAHPFFTIGHSSRSVPELQGARKTTVEDGLTLSFGPTGTNEAGSAPRESGATAATLA
jgi:hypothetical protein